MTVSEVVQSLMMRDGNKRLGYINDEGAFVEVHEVRYKNVMIGESLEGPPIYEVAVVLVEKKTGRKMELTQYRL
jgi:hypothetical protein